MRCLGYIPETVSESSWYRCSGYGVVDCEGSNGFDRKFG